MPFYQLIRKQELAADVNEIWDFISSPKNLKEITPKSMGFDITSGDLPEKMYTGMIISYKVKPLLGIPTTWVTEITHIDDKKFFIDEQRVGPYKIWHHQHFIELTKKGVLMTDIVSYQPPFGFVGAIANALIIRKKIEEIFDFRKEILHRKFNLRNT